MLIDSHAHLDSDILISSFNEIIKNAIINNISSILTINTKLDNFNKLYNLIKDYNSIWCSVGEHPNYIKNDNIPTTKEILNLINNKVIGIGETGIDLYYSDDQIDYQFESFKNHIDASIESNLPLIIHLRNSENELMNFLIKENKKTKLKVVFHCFTGSMNLLRKCLDNDFFISISGIVTFKNSSELQNTVKNIPLNKLLIETDSPYLAPMPNRGKNNQPSYIKFTADFLSQLLNINFEELSERTTQNFYDFFTKAIKYEKISHES